MKKGNIFKTIWFMQDHLLAFEDCSNIAYFGYKKINHSPLFWNEKLLLTSAISGSMDRSQGMRRKRTCFSCGRVKVPRGQTGCVYHATVCFVWVASARASPSCGQQIILVPIALFLSLSRRGLGTRIEGASILVPRPRRLTDEKKSHGDENTSKCYKHLQP